MHSQAPANTSPGVLQPQPAELQALSGVLDDRDSAIRNGMTIDGQRYEVCCSSSIDCSSSSKSGINSTCNARVPEPQCFVHVEIAQHLHLLLALTARHHATHLERRYISQEKLCQATCVKVTAAQESNTTSKLNTKGLGTVHRLLTLQVHRFHPPLAYGRTMGCAPEASVGAALCKVEQGPTGQPCFGVITYK
jgi:hypothetical protein